jgi:hypothetical protein
VRRALATRANAAPPIPTRRRHVHRAEFDLLANCHEMLSRA